MADFGADVSVFYGGALDINPTGAVISGPGIVLEGIAKRLMTPKGLLRRHPNYGFDLRTRIGARISEVGLRRLESAIRTEVQAQEGVLAAPTVRLERAGSTYQLTIAVDLAEGPFALVLDVSNVTVKILRAGKA